jgi:hypothetical protein
MAKFKAMVFIIGFLVSFNIFHCEEEFSTKGKIMTENEIHRNRSDLYGSYVKSTIMSLIVSLSASMGISGLIIYLKEGKQ